MENIEFFTLEISSSSHPEFVPCTFDGKVLEYSSFEDAVSNAPSKSCFKGNNTVIRVVRHVHFSQVVCEVSKFNEPFKFESYG